MIEADAARADEFARVREIVAQAFSSPDEADLWDYLVARDPGLTPECVRVARLTGRIVACTVVLPRSIRSRIGLVQGAVVTLVACDPEYQGQGYGSASVRDALEYMASLGCALGILYGHPTYYPRFGFTPVLARASTDLAAPLTWCGSSPQLQPVGEQDLPGLTSLFASQLGIYPCGVARMAEPWVWQPRHGAEVVSCFGQAGYAVLTANRERGVLRVHEACTTPGEEDELLAALHGRARQEELQIVSLAVPPDHPLAQRARELGARTEIAPASAGMGVILDWQPLLPSGYRVVSNVLMYLDRPVLRAPLARLTQLVLGSLDLSTQPADSDIDLLQESKSQLVRDFPPLFPHWSLEPFWF